MNNPERSNIDRQIAIERSLIRYAAAFDASDYENMANLKQEFGSLDEISSDLLDRVKEFEDYRVLEEKLIVIEDEFESLPPELKAAAVNSMNTKRDPILRLLALAEFVAQRIPDGLTAEYFKEESLGRQDMLELLIPEYLPDLTVNLDGILLEAKVVGLTPDQLAKSLKVDIAILTKLDRRLLDPHTIPLHLIAEIANTLRCRAAEVLTYLTAPPRLPASAMFKVNAPRNRARPGFEMRADNSAPAPVPVSRGSFENAVNNSTLSADEKRYWLDQDQPLA